MLSIDGIRNSSTITVKSFVIPSNGMEDFKAGKPFKTDLSSAMTVGQFTQWMFSKTRDQIGMVVVNGQIATENTLLTDGDRVDLYPLLEGG